MVDGLLVSLVYSALRLDFIAHKILFAAVPPENQCIPEIPLGQTKQTAYREISIVYGLFCFPTIHVWTQWSCRKMVEGSV